jgi:hypothetical protein
VFIKLHPRIAMSNMDGDVCPARFLWDLIFLMAVQFFGVFLGAYVREHIMGTVDPATGGMLFGALFMYMSMREGSLFSDLLHERIEE